VQNAREIDSPMRDEEATADSIIEQAKLQGGGRVSGHWEKVRAGQAGRRIIEEAQDMRAAAVVMTLPRRIAGTSVFGKTVETVLAERPCRVIIESRPAAATRHAHAPETATVRV
jgi:APA family basic amino acid/polyamine antiporter